MCEIKAYAYVGGKEDLLLENVDTVRVEGGKIFLRNLFGEERVFEGSLRELSVRKNKLVLEGREKI